MIELNQNGRAGMEFLGSLQKFSSSVLRDEAQRDFAAIAGPAAVCEPIGDVDPEPVIARAAQIAESSQALRFERFYQRFVAEQLYDRGIATVEERREAAEKALKTNIDPQRAGTLILNPDLEMPDYYAGVEWHLQPGGWDGYDLSMPMFAAGVAPLVFAHGGYAAVVVGANIREHRKAVLEELPRRDYARLYEAGSGGVVTLATARQLFPEAELVGGDLSQFMLEAGHRMAGIMELNVTLRQEDSCNTAEADESVGAVICYATLHEMPDDAVQALFHEMYRITEPGGDIVISDPPPLKAVSPFQGYLLDWEGNHREEPHIPAHIRRDLPGMLRKAGYEVTAEKALGPAQYPWVTLAHKPTRKH